MNNPNSFQLTYDCFPSHITATVSYMPNIFVWYMPYTILLNGGVSTCRKPHYQFSVTLELFIENHRTTVICYNLIRLNFCLQATVLYMPNIFVCYMAYTILMNGGFHTIGLLHIYIFL